MIDSKDEHGVVVIGAGQAALRTATELRRLGHQAPITLLGEEEHLPYERPQLSKQFLTADAGQHAAILSAADIDALGIVVQRDTVVASIDRKSRCAVTIDGAGIRYEQLVIATGGTPRAIGGMAVDQRRIFVLRTTADAARIRRAAATARSVLVVGGGWLGLEIASSLSRRDIEVTVIEGSDRVCARVAPPEVSGRLQDLAETHNVRVLTSTPLRALSSGESTVVAAFGTAEREAFDLAILAVGMVPNVALATHAGLATDSGIVVDEACRTSDPAIYAVGDCAEQHNAFLGASLRLESWQNANFQAEVAAASIVGAPLPPAQVPWFWSDQFGVNIQMLGRTFGKGLRRVVRDDGARSSILFLEGDVLVGIVAFDAPRDVGMARRLIEGRVGIDHAKAGDPLTPLSKAAAK